MKNIYIAILLSLFLTTVALAEVNINTASQHDLTALAGIGPAKAEAIVKYREANGLFENTSDLKKVKGIGDKIFEKVQAEIILKEPVVKEKTVALQVKK